MVHIISSILAGPHSGLFREALVRYFPSLDLSPEHIALWRNANTMGISLQSQFCASLVSLEAIEKHSYRIRDCDPSVISLRYLPESGKVSFVDHDPHYKFPSPVLLEVHAVIP